MTRELGCASCACARVCVRIRVYVSLRVCASLRACVATSHPLSTLQSSRIPQIAEPSSRPLENRRSGSFAVRNSARARDSAWRARPRAGAGAPEYADGARCARLASQRWRAHRRRRCSAGARESTLARTLWPVVISIPSSVFSYPVCRCILFCPPSPPSPPQPPHPFHQSRSRACGAAVLHAAPAQPCGHTQKQASAGSL